MSKVKVFIKIQDIFMSDSDFLLRRLLSIIDVEIL